MNMYVVGLLAVSAVVLLAYQMFGCATCYAIN